LGQVALRSVILRSYAKKFRINGGETVRRFHSNFPTNHCKITYLQFHALHFVQQNVQQSTGCPSNRRVRIPNTETAAQGDNLGGGGANGELRKSPAKEKTDE
jgi:hypothetical protein